MAMMAAMDDRELRERCMVVVKMALLGLIRGNLVKGVDRDEKYCVSVKQGKEY